MYSRRFLSAAPTGRRKTTDKIAKKIAKLTNWTIAVPSGRRNTGSYPLLRDDREVRDHVRHLHDDEEQIEREAQSDDREGFQDADAQEHERQDVRTCFGLTGDRFDGFAGDDAVADGRTERDGGDDDAEREEGKAGDQRF